VRELQTAMGKYFYGRAEYSERTAVTGLRRIIGKHFFRGPDERHVPLYDESDRAKRLKGWPLSNTARRAYITLPMFSEGAEVIGYGPVLLRLDEIGGSISETYSSLWSPWTGAGFVWKFPGTDVFNCYSEPKLEATEVNLGDGLEAYAISTAAEWLKYGIPSDPQKYTADQAGWVAAARTTVVGVE